MGFDLMAYAREHRYRVRNLHDSHPVLPARPPKHGKRGRFAGYLGGEDRVEAIACRHGYVCEGGHGRLGWYLFARTTRSMRAKLKKLVALGVTVKQEGDHEAGGDASVDQLTAVLDVLVPLLVPKHPGRKATLARQASATGSGGASVPGASEVGSEGGCLGGERR